MLFPAVQPHLTFQSHALLCSNAAIEKWAKYKEDFHLRFKYTPRVVRDSLLWGVLVPIGVYWLMRSQQV